jgi:hypothetical protein
LMKNIFFVFNWMRWWWYMSIDNCWRWCY